MATMDDMSFQKEVLNDTKNVWFLIFVAPSCGECRDLLADWTAAQARLYSAGAMIAFVDGTSQTTLADSLGVHKYPTIKVFPGGHKTLESAMEYTGGRTTPQIVKHALEEVDRSGFPKKILELTSQNLFDETCHVNVSNICILVALPHILDTGADRRNKYRDTLATVAKSARGLGWFDFFWFEGGNAQMELESSLELNFGYPAVVAVIREKGVYSVFRGSFSEKTIGAFLSSIASGRQKTTKLESPLRVANAEGWDGMDVEAIEEESLADIMGDDWESEL